MEVQNDQLAEMHQFLKELVSQQDVIKRSVDSIQNALTVSYANYELMSKRLNLIEESLRLIMANFLLHDLDGNDTRAIETAISVPAQKSIEKQGEEWLKSAANESNVKKAFEWYRKSAELGNIEAMQQLSRMYFTGTGTKTNQGASIFWNKMREKRNVNSYANWLYILGRSYRFGDGVKRNTKRAAEILKLAADEGSQLADADLKDMTRRCENVRIHGRNGKACQHNHKSSKYHHYDGGKPAANGKRNSCSGRTAPPVTAPSIDR